MMQRPGGMPGQNGTPAGDTLGDAKGMRSVFNPTDISMSLQDGELTPDSTIGDLLNKLGVTVNDRIAELAPIMKQQMDSANPVNKMRKLAQKQPPGMPRGAPPQSGPAPQGGPPTGSFSEMFPQGG